MPLAYSIDPDAGLVTITGEYAQPSEWRVLLGELRRDPRLRPGMGFLRDLRRSHRPVDADAVSGIIAVVGEFWEKLGARRAAIVTGPRIDIPAAVAEALAQSENIPLRGFTHYEDAVAWLRSDT